MQVHYFNGANLNVTAFYEFYICAEINALFTETQYMKPKMQRVVWYEVTEFAFSLFFQRTRCRLSVL